MLKPKKKISKKEIKEDRLVTSYYEATSWYQNNKKLVNGVLTGLVVVAIVVFAYINNVSSNNQKATAELGKVLSYYDQGRYDVAINVNLQENVRGLQAIVDDYGSTKAGEERGNQVGDGEEHQRASCRPLRAALKEETSIASPSA